MNFIHLENPRKFLISVCLRFVSWILVVSFDDAHAFQFLLVLPVSQSAPYVSTVTNSHALASR
ncbi:unnamed protein product [Coffea canephora]|uniref:DH200=94 genomic scaffold, scaffold_1197 n=1 Tax=Coffea canephora TaxID=49390 RepID=A0A068VL74_COFCA|nr:unnamed protein product [Coffea canephora]